MLSDIESQIVALIATLPASARLRILEVVVAESMAHVKSVHAVGKNYNVLLTGAPADKWIGTIKAIRTCFDTTLKDAKDIVDRVRLQNETRIIAKNVSHASAAQAKTLIEETGATVELLVAE